LQSGTTATKDFNFQMSTADLGVRVPTLDSDVLPSFYERFEYPGGYMDGAAGEDVERRYVEWLSSTHDVATASTNSRGLLVGYLFNLEDHPVDNVNSEYLLTSARFTLHPHNSRSGGNDESVIRSEITALASAKSYRPARATPKPVMGGPQTAVVVGNPEDEILTDLLPRNIAVQVFRALLENNASFYGAQMSAMDNATRNAGEMIKKQTLKYNRTRQAQITKELIEIISGAEAL